MLSGDALLNLEEINQNHNQRAKTYAAEVGSPIYYQYINMTIFSNYYYYEKLVRY